MFSISFSINSYSQKDTAKEVEAHYFYVAGNMNTFVNTIGAFNNRVSFSSEIGITFGIFDLGIATGKLNSLKNDSSWFIELRPTINIFSKGRFSESLCLAGGYKFNSKENFMTEICNGINFNINEFWSISVLQGYYFFEGKTSNTNKTFFGLNVTHNFIKKNGKVDMRKRKALLN